MPRPTVWAADQCATSRIRHMGGSKRSASASRHACRVEPETPDTALSVAQRAPGLLIHG